MNLLFTVPVVIGLLHTLMKTVSSTPVKGLSLQPDENSQSDTDAPESGQNDSFTESGENGLFNKLSQHTLFMQTGKTYSDSMTLSITLKYSLDPHYKRIAEAKTFFEKCKQFRTDNKDNLAFVKVMLDIESVYETTFHSTLDRFRRIMKMLEFKVTNIETSTENRFERSVCDEKFCLPYNVTNLTDFFEQSSMDKFHIDTNFQYHNGYESPDIVKSRHKRLAGLVIAGVGLLATAIVSLVMSAYSVAEIKNLWKALESIQESHNSLVIDVQNLSSQVGNISVLMNELYEFQQLAIKNNPAVTASKFHVKLKAVDDDVTFLEHLFSDLQKSRLYEGFFRQNDGNYSLASLMLAANEKAAETGYRPLVNHEIEYLALDVSHLIINTEIIIIMHVPCVREDSEMTIYKLLPFPYPLSLNFEKEYFGSNNESGLYLEAENQLIAVDKYNSRFKLFSESYLQTCFHRNTLYVCENNNRVLKNFKNHCISALYTQNIEAIHAHCMFRRRPLVEHVVQIGNENFLIFSPISCNAMVSCANFHSSQNVEIESYVLTNVTLPYNCFMALPESDQYSAKNVKLTSFTIRSFHSSDLLNFPSHLMEDAARFDKKLLNFTIKNDKFFRESQKLTEDIGRSFNRHKMSPSSFWDFLSFLPSFLPSFVIYGLIGVCVISVLVLLWQYNRKTKKYQQLDEKKTDNNHYVVNNLLSTAPPVQPSANPNYPVEFKPAM